MENDNLEQNNENTNENNDNENINENKDNTTNENKDSPTNDTTTPIKTKEELIEELNEKLNQITKLKVEGNTLFSSGSNDEAIEKYSNAKEIAAEFDKIFSEYLLSDNKDQEFKTIYKNYRKEKIAIYSNIALCYSKKNMYQESIDHDLKVFTYIFNIIIRLLQRLIQILTNHM
jgi:tetratricopeptide (TPR) repeat protein